MTSPRTLVAAGWLSTVATTALVALGVTISLHGLGWRTGFEDGELVRSLVIVDPNRLIGGNVLAVFGVLALLSTRLLVGAARPHQRMGA